MKAKDIPKSNPKPKSKPTKDKTHGSQQFSTTANSRHSCPVSSGTPIASPSVSAPQHFALWPAWREAASPASLIRLDGNQRRLWVWVLRKTTR
jgi:hypothetical protein